MHLAIVVNRFPVLSESFIFNKVSSLLSAGLDVTVLAQEIASDRAMFVGRIDSLPARLLQHSLLAGGVSALPSRLAQSMLSNPRLSIRLWQQAIKRYGHTRRALKAWVLALPLALGRYEVIHFEYSGLAVSYRDALPLLPARLLVSCRGTAEKVMPVVDPTRKEQLRQVFQDVDRIHCVSADMQSVVEGYGAKPGQAFVNHPAIDAERFRRQAPYPQKSAGPYRLISVGRLHWIKGLEFSLLAVRQLLDAGYDVEYEIIGGGDDEPLLYTIAALGLSKHVFLRGRLPSPSVREALEVADVCLLPSLSEGISNAVLEAMAMELPIVSTTAGGMGEAITDGQEGFLVPPWQPAALAEKIGRLLQDFSLRQAMGQAGRRRVEQEFNLSRQTSCFVAEYTHLLESDLAQK